MAGKPGFASLRAEYAQLWSSMVVTRTKVPAADAICQRIVSNRRKYEAVQQATNVPWFVVAVIHSLESGLNFGTHLHNGDPLTRRTTHVPAGRPAEGNPPFTWEYSAADALRMKAFDKNTDWSLERVAYLLESYNGWGYRMYHPGTLSPYLWSFSNHYRSGKYVADGKWDQAAVSQQCGAMVLLKRLEAAGVISFGAASPVQPDDPGPLAGVDPMAGPPPTPGFLAALFAFLRRLFGG